MLKENARTISFFVTIVSFVICMNLQGHYIVKLNVLLKKINRILKKRLILIDFGYALFIPRPIIVKELNN